MNLILTIIACFNKTEKCQPQPQRIVEAVLRFTPNLTFNVKELHLIPIFASNTFVYKLNMVKQHQTGPKSLFMVVYRPPNSTTDFCHSLSKLIDYALSHYGEIIVGGDFNIDLLQKKKSNLSTIFSDAGFTQIIKMATRVNNNTSTLIDHIYTTHPNRIVQSFVPVHGMSDHFPVCFVDKFR